MSMTLKARLKYYCAAVYYIGRLILFILLVIVAFFWFIDQLHEMVEIQSFWWD